MMRTQPRPETEYPRACRARVRRPCGNHVPDGFTLVEAVVASVLLGAVAVCALPTLHWIAAQEAASYRRQVANEELANVLERLTDRPWEQITNEVSDPVELDQDVQRQLPGAQLTVSVDREGESAKRIHALLSWDRRPGQPRETVQLTTWIYHIRERLDRSQQGEDGEP